VKGSSVQLDHLFSGILFYGIPSQRTVMFVYAEYMRKLCRCIYDM
jgi:hypothetical protein